MAERRASALSRGPPSAPRSRARCSTILGSCCSTSHGPPRRTRGGPPSQRLAAEKSAGVRGSSPPTPRPRGGPRRASLLLVRAAQPGSRLQRCGRRHARSGRERCGGTHGRRPVNALLAVLWKDLCRVGRPRSPRRHGCVRAAGGDRALPGRPTWRGPESRAHVLGCSGCLPVRGGTGLNRALRDRARERALSLLPSRPWSAASSSRQGARELRAAARGRGRDGRRVALAFDLDLCPWRVGSAGVGAGRGRPVLAGHALLRGRVRTQYREVCCRCSCCRCSCRAAGRGARPRTRCCSGHAALPALQLLLVTDGVSSSSPS